MDELYVRVKGGGEICVPAGSMSAYVLLEQEGGLRSWGA
jgi:hypothetical protein